MRNALIKILLITFLAGPAAFAAGTVNITVDISSSGKTIANKFSDINMWMINRTWLKNAATYPKDYFSANFPFVQRVQLMAATGGNEDRDLFKNPADPRADYDGSGSYSVQDAVLLAQNFYNRSHGVGTPLLRQSLSPHYAQLNALE